VEFEDITCGDPGIDRKIFKLILQLQVKVWIKLALEESWRGCDAMNFWVT
jgi:hypothetical protein